jgi:hypothetical protein
MHGEIVVTRPSFTADRGGGSWHVAACRGEAVRGGGRERGALGPWRTAGTTRAMPQGGDQRSHRIEAYRDVILAVIDAQVDITLVELAEMLRKEHGASFAPSTIWRFLDRHAMTIKKNGTRQRADAARRRSAARGLVRRPA